ncbi:class I SAM-dependent methyltransferase [Taibaiella soli]|uniref:Class I SAM-dependent methyltransferase n=1 Tax=Taibaiella soli TaxID=1649169 RepID=A0A2W2AHF3_9BACT|nr:class I SAM-dependent methyltransferase [Taibaiella soli]PZF74925.1 class I SAM-dependent methyltransferase [Taibaiella soli]
MNSKERFSNRVADYIKYRPHYPEAIIDFLQAQYELSAGKLIADIGAGTGISSELFLEAGYPVIGVEPNKEMREASEELLQQYKTFRAVDGSAEHTGLDSGSVHAIVCGQAFHWFDIAKAKEEFKRILKKNGLVILIWNERRVASDFEKEYDLLIEKHARDYIKVGHRNIDLENIQAFFAPNSCQLETFANSQIFDFNGLEGRLVSSSYMPPRNDAGYVPMITDLKQLFDRYQSNNSITIQYDTKVYVGRL